MVGSMLNWQVYGTSQLLAEKWMVESMLNWQVYGTEIY